MKDNLDALGPYAERRANGLSLAWGVVSDAIARFNDSDGWAIASHIALSILMSVFPFLIVVAAISGLVGSHDLEKVAARLLFDTWPPAIAAPIVSEIQRVAVGAHGEAITLGAVFSVYFATAGIESLRIGLNRAYGVKEDRSWLRLRLTAIFYVVLSAVALLLLTVFVVLGPVFATLAKSFFPWLLPFKAIFAIGRFLVTPLIVAATLCGVHLWLPAGRRRFAQIAPGVAFTLTVWLVTAAGFGAYLAAFAYRYVLLYAGLSSVMIALIFLYYSGVIFIYGGELNAAISRCRAAIARDRDAVCADSREPA